MDMYFNNKERINTGVALLIAVLIIGYVDNYILTWLSFGGVYILALQESVKLFKIKDTHPLPYAFGLWFLAGIYPSADDLFVLTGVAYASAVAFNKKLSWNDYLPFIYPTAGILFIFALYQQYGMPSLLWLIAVVALSDIGAYVVGKSIGKTKFCETSPNKTREGVIGGVTIATLVVSFLV